MERPQLHPETFLKYMTDEDLIEVIQMGELDRLCTSMTIDFHMLEQHSTQNQA